MLRRITEGFFSLFIYIFYRQIGTKFRTDVFKFFWDIFFVVLEKIGFKFDVISSNYIKLYDDILKAKDKLLMNKRLMELDNPHIPTNQKLQILDRFNVDDIEFKKLDFLRIGQKYKVLQNWRDINDWLHSTFHNIITK